MPRLLAALAVFLILLAGLGVLVWYLAFGTGPRSVGDADVPGLSAPVTIGYDETGLATVEAQSETDLFAGLGYVHALDRAWPLALWRQAATGGLTGWFNDSTALALDHHALTLGLEASARSSYDALGEEDQAVLEAYARGINRAFERARLSEGDDFVKQDVRAEPWEPWHALAIERLIAYLATAPPSLPDSVATAAYHASPLLRAWTVADSSFRAALGIGGLEHSVAFTFADSTGTTLVQRHVTGSSALPLFYPVRLRQGARETLVASVPGTLVFPAGVGDRAWSILLSGMARLTSSADTTAPRPTYARIVHRDGDETLVTAYREPDALVLYDPDLPRPEPTVIRDSLGRVDTLAASVPERWRVRWSGFEASTDLGTWRALLQGEEPSFALFPGAGVVLNRDGSAQMLGRPVVSRQRGGVFAGMHPDARWVADRGAALDDTVKVGPNGLLADAYSMWAAELAPPLIAALGRPGEEDEDLRDASAYLRGWDFRYAPASIGASIFSRWMTTHREVTGALPNPDSVAVPPPPPDSLGRTAPQPAREAVKQTLRLALRDLRETFGPDWAQWRWQNVQDTEIAYPFFDDERGPFAPFHVPDGGHPTAIAWGPSPLFPDAAASTAWSAWISTSSWPVLHVRHRNLYDAPRTALRLDDPVDSARLAPSEPVRTVRLTPSSD